MGIMARLSLGVTLLSTVMLTLVLSAASARADTNDFSYDSWRADYQISTDAEGRAVTHVTETLTARFPDYDQNRGIVRGLPIRYEGASTQPRDFKVTDLTGAPIPFEIEEDSSFVAVLTGDDRYVRGVQTYVISYTLSDTVLARDDGKADEFYWDLLDFEHLQPIKEFTANLSFSPELASKLNGDTRCYAGVARSTQECTLIRSSSGADFAVPATPLAAEEAVTVAIGLAPATVTQPPARIPNFGLDTLPILLGSLAVATGAIGAVAALLLRRKRRTGRGVIVAQYDVPASLPPLLAASIAGTSASPMPAEFVHLAVTGVIRIEEIEGKKKPRPALRLLDPARVRDELDAATVNDLFPELTIGAVTKIPKNSEKFAQRMAKLTSLGSAAATTRGYFEKVASPLGRVLGWITLGITSVAMALAVLNIITRESEMAAIPLIVGIIAIALGLVGIMKHRVHTQLGAETREYLAGVKLFITVAEADRIRMLQSYAGAERVQDGEVNIVQLCEKLLPYAMMFGLEKQWGKVLETRYLESPGYVPYWYPGLGVHGLSGINSTLSQFTS